MNASQRRRDRRIWIRLLDLPLPLNKPAVVRRFGYGMFLTRRALGATPYPYGRAELGVSAVSRVNG